MPRPCPHCQADVSGYRLATICPRCHRDLPPLLFESLWVDWKKVILLTFAPAVACLFGMMLHAGSIAVLMGFIGSCGCGLYSARLVMEGFSLAGWRKPLLHFVIAIISCGLSGTFCFLGCAGGASVTGQR